MTWTLNNVASDVVGVSNIAVTWTNQAADKLEFAAPGRNIDAAPLYNYGTLLDVKQDGVRVFYGRLISNPISGSGRGQDHAYAAAGPWDWLDHILYQQSRKVGAATVTSTRVFLGQKADGTKLTNGAQIAEVLAYAISQGAPIAAGVISPASSIPFDECVDLTCAEAVKRLLRWSPDCVAAFDYSTLPPTLNIRSRASMPAATVAALGAPASGIGIRSRPDLQKLGVALTFESVFDSDGLPTRGTTLDAAGNLSDPARVIRQTIELGGGSATYTKQKIVTAPLNTETLLYERFPWLADVTLESVMGAGGRPSHSRYLVSGQLPDWAESAEDSFAYDVTFTDAKNSKITQRLRFTVTTTPLTSGTRSSLASMSPPEPVPTGMAAALLSALSTLHYEGTISLTAASCPLSARPGMVLNITSGRPEWASMRALIQTVTLAADTGVTRIQFGPPDHLGPQDLLEQLRANRQRNVSVHFESRTNGDAAPNAGTTSGKTPTTTSQPAPAGYEKFLVVAAGVSIALDPGECQGKNLTPRAISVCHEGQAKTMIVLASEPF